MTAHIHRTLARRYRPSDCKSEAFYTLQKEWYAKLAASGFRDIEQWKLQENGNMEAGFLVDHVGRGRAVAIQGKTTGGEDLFVVLGRHFHVARFASFRQRTWALLYVNGWRGAEIARLFPTTNAKTVTAFLSAFRAEALACGLHADAAQEDEEEDL